MALPLEVGRRLLRGGRVATPVLAQHPDLSHHSRDSCVRPWPFGQSPGSDRGSGRAARTLPTVPGPHERCHGSRRCRGVEPHSLMELRLRPRRKRQSSGVGRGRTVQHLPSRRQFAASGAYARGSHHPVRAEWSAQAQLDPFRSRGRAASRRHRRRSARAPEPRAQTPHVHRVWRERTRSGGSTERESTRPLIGPAAPGTIAAVASPWFVLMLGFASCSCSRSAGRRFAFPGRGQSAMRCATSYFVTETRRPGVSPVGIALSVSSPCL